LDQKREEYEVLERETDRLAEGHRKRIKEFRDKRGVLNVLVEGSVDDAEVAELQSRIDGMDDVIKRLDGSICAVVHVWSAACNIFPLPLSIYF
jgi:hypothetical protein